MGTQTPHLLNTGRSEPLLLTHSPPFDSAQNMLSQTLVSWGTQTPHLLNTGRSEPLLLTTHLLLTLLKICCPKPLLAVGTQNPHLLNTGRSEPLLLTTPPFDSVQNTLSQTLVSCGDPNPTFVKYRRV